jgi:hypothetical protein
MEAVEIRRGRRLMGALITAVIVLLGASASADAGIVHPYLGSFGPDGTAGTSFGRPGAVAVDQSDGDVYVADTAAGAIYKFGPEGEPVNFGALGSNKLEGLSFSDGEPGLVELAVNSTTHDLYVVENAPVNGVSVFKANGEPAEFSALGAHTLTGFSELCGVAVDSEGDVYAADYEGGISVFDASGAAMTTVAVSHVCSIAVGPGGALYANTYEGPVSQLTPSSFPVTGATTYDAGTVIAAGPVVGVAVDPTSGDLYADERNAIAQYDGGGTLLGRAGSVGEGALGESEGVAVDGSDGRLFATAPGAGTAASGLVFRYGPEEVEQPRVEGEWASAVGDVEVNLNAEINPLGVPATYRFEYGVEPCGSGGCAASTEGSLGAGTEALTVSQPIGGLQPNRTYDFRVVVTTTAGSRPGPERSFRTYATAAGASSLPDDRGYELVSPGPDDSAELGVPGPAAGLVIGGVLPQRAAADGSAFVFPSFTAFGAATGAPNASYYLSRRSAAGWSMANITPRDETRAPVGPVRAFSADLASTAIVANSMLAPGAVAGYPNLYLRDNATGALTALTTSTPEHTSPGGFCVNYIGASADGSRVIFAASGGLTPEAPAPEQGGQPNLYEWSAAEGIRLVSILPGGTPAATGKQLGFGPGDDSCLIDGIEVTRHPISADGSRIFWSQAVPRALFARVEGTRTIELDDARGGAGPSGGGDFLAASADGSRVFFTDPNPLVPGASQGAHGEFGGDLYEYRLPSEELIDLTPPAGEPSEVLGLVGASDDGDYVYFVAAGALTGGAEAGAANLYLDHEGSLQLVTRLSRSEDGFDWNRFSRQTAAVSPDGLHLAFVSVEPLTGYDNELAGGQDCRRGSEGEPEGGRGCDEVYLYDVDGNRLSCASCNPSGANPSGPVKGTTGNKESRLNVVPGWTTPFEQPRYLSADGSRLFFVSEEGLLPADTNGEQDVYEFERPGAGGDDCSAGSPAYVPESEGCLSLISSGRSSDSSYLLDASSNGSDVFFSTNQALVPGDEDGSYDIYDARVGGSSPAAAPAPTPCVAEGCRSASGPSPGMGSVGTGTEGEGDYKQPRCPRGKVRRGNRCQAKHHRPKHHKKLRQDTKRGGRR